MAHLILDQGGPPIHGIAVESLGQPEAPSLLH